MENKQWLQYVQSLTKRTEAIRGKLERLHNWPKVPKAQRIVAESALDHLNNLEHALFNTIELLEYELGVRK